MTARVIEIVGSGCVKCELLAQHAEEAARALGIAYTIVKVKDPSAWARHGIMMTPALVVDGQVKLQGRVPSADTLRRLIAPDPIPHTP
jgi:small redox-active disulfide protein 2